jgi:hypothetical protein
MAGAAVLPALAVDDAAEARLVAAVRVVKITTADAMTEAMIRALWPPLRERIVSQNPAASPELLDVVHQITADVTREMVSDVSGDMVNFYASQFTTEELDALLAFYESPVGGKLLASTPSLMNQVMPQVLEKTQTMMPRLTEEVRKAALQRGLNLGV